MNPALSVWPPLPPAAFLRPARAQLPFPLDEEGCRLYSCGRHALYAGVLALGLREGDEVLVPAYNHGSEVEALARAGLVPRWYGASGSLEPDGDELETLVGSRTRALHLIHYLGFPQDGVRWRRWCDERGLLLLEDAAQSWLAETEAGPAGSFGHLSIVCFYKSVGVPDGAALVVDGEVSGTGRPRLGGGAAARKSAAWLAGRSGRIASVLARVPRSGAPADEFTLGDWESAPSRATTWLVPRLAGLDVAAARRANYEVLLEELGENVAEPFGVVPAGASPFAFPFDTDEKADFLERIARGGVAGLDLWSGRHPLLVGGQFTHAARRRQRTVGLPVHQQLGPDGVQQVLRAVRGARRRSPEPRLRAEEFDGIRDGWATLAEQTENVFATPDWAELWWGHFGDGKTLLLRSLRGVDDRLRAVLPIYVWKERPVRVARIVGHHAGDQLGPVAAPHDRPAAARALRRLLVEERCDAFVGDQTAASEGWRPLLGARLLADEGSPVLRVGGLDWEGYLASRSKNFRDQVRGRERKLARAHDISFRLCDDPARLPEDMSTLFRLHRARWAGAATNFGAREAFHRDFALRALERGWLRLWLLELGGTPAAAWYGFRYGRSESYYQAGRLPELDRESVGFVLMAHTIREAIAAGAEEYRLLRGGEEYKYRFAALDRGLETIGLGLTPRGTVALGAARAARSGRRAAAKLSR